MSGCSMRSRRVTGNGPARARRRRRNAGREEGRKGGRAGNEMAGAGLGEPHIGRGRCEITTALIASAMRGARAEWDDHMEVLGMHCIIADHLVTQRHGGHVGGRPSTTWRHCSSASTARPSAPCHHASLAPGSARAVSNLCVPSSTPTGVAASTSAVMTLGRGDSSGSTHRSRRASTGRSTCTAVTRGSEPARRANVSRAGRYVSRRGETQRSDALQGWREQRSSGRRLWSEDGTTKRGG